MNERDQLTIEAARRLLRSRLRQHLLRKEKEYFKERGREECLDLSVDSEKMIEVASEAAWISTLRLWSTTGDLNSPVRQMLEVLVQNALESAVEGSRGYIDQRGVECEPTDVGAWVLEFIHGFDSKSLLGKMGSCASAT
jgi:hypothetical protein